MSSILDDPQLMPHAIRACRSPETAADLLPSVPLYESPFFGSSWSDALGADAFAVASDLRRQGYALLDIDEWNFDALAASIIEQLKPQYPWDAWHASGNANMRLQDAWRTCPEVRELACLGSIVDLLSAVYGRPMFPFQTLNFACGSQQHLHADAVHFNTLPDAWMCGVWVALEDVDADNGPLLYAPGSHRFRFAQNLDIGVPAEAGDAHQGRFHDLWDALAASGGLQVEPFHARKGQVLIWTAHLLHGGDRHRVRERTRWSQVTHFYAQGCLYYTPMRSNLAVGPMALRKPIDLRTGETVANTYLGMTVDEEKLRAFSALAPEEAGFDAATYLLLNPDVAASGMDAYEHYVKHGRLENRRIR